LRTAPVRHVGMSYLSLSHLFYCSCEQKNRFPIIKSKAFDA
jgi:hypothetical protein